MSHIICDLLSILWLISQYRQGMTAMKTVRITVIGTQYNFDTTVWVNDNGRPLDNRHHEMKLDGDTLCDDRGGEWRIAPRSVASLRHQRVKSLRQAAHH